MPALLFPFNGISAQCHFFPTLTCTQTRVSRLHRVIPERLSAWDSNPRLTLVINGIKQLHWSALTCLNGSLEPPQKLVVGSEGPDTFAPRRLTPLVSASIPVLCRFRFLSTQTHTQTRCPGSPELFCLLLHFQKYSGSLGIEENLLASQPGHLTHDYIAFVISVA